MQMLLHRLVSVYAPLDKRVCLLVPPDVFQTRHKMTFLPCLKQLGTSFRMIPIDMQEVSSFWHWTDHVPAPSIETCRSDCRAISDVLRAFYSVKLQAAIFELDFFLFRPLPLSEWALWRYPCTKGGSPWMHRMWNLSAEHSRGFFSACDGTSLASCNSILKTWTIDATPVRSGSVPGICSFSGMCLRYGENAADFMMRDISFATLYGNCSGVHLSGSKLSLLSRPYWSQFLQKFGYTIVVDPADPTKISNISHSS